MLHRIPSLATRIAALGFPLALLSALPCQAQIHVPTDYPTIQQAVDAATSGTTITVASGLYEEQVLIAGKDLTLIGDPGATLVSPPSLAAVQIGPGGVPRKPVLGVTACRVDIDGFAFDGLRRGDANFRFTGELYVDARGSVSHCSFTGFRSQALAFTPSPERAVQMSNVQPGPVDVAVRSCSFSDNVDSIFMSGGMANLNALAVVCDVSDNVIVGLGPQPSLTQNGIFLASGVTGALRGNHVSGHAYLGNNNFSIAILTGSLGFPPTFAMPRLRIENNTTVSNNVGILSLFASRTRIVNNSVTSGPFAVAGIAVSGPRNWILHNSIDMAQSIVPGNSGVLLLGAEFNAVFGTGFASATRVVANTISGADIPIWSQTGVTGTRMHGNVIQP